MQEPLIQLLRQLASGSSNEIIPTFAAVKGDLPHFVSRLIKYNDISRHIEENDKIQPYAKALIFDLTFTILCSIVQNYGSHVSL
jgi:mediator of RNA polymerase II transcription subunit 24